MKSKIVTVIITMISAAIFILYGKLIFFAASQDSLPRFGLLAIALSTAAVVLAMIYTGYRRMKEIDKEDKDDLSKY